MAHAVALAAGAWLALTPLTSARAADTIVLASTTSTEQSGLFAHLLPLFREATGIRVNVVAVGTGQALELGRRGDADVVLVHDPAAEERFVAQGWATRRHEVMANDFVLLGPRADPAQVRGGLDAVAAFGKIAAARAEFISRGDRSGTHAAELGLWAAGGIDVARRGADWYRETGSGMGPTLNVASARGAYTLADRGTWLAFRNRGELEILVAGDPRLLNRYAVMLVNPARHPHVRAAAGQQFIDWLTGAPGQAAIAQFRIGGEPLFRPMAR